jgi:tetratricopeptide (TPR) repeat protein
MLLHANKAVSALLVVNLYDVLPYFVYSAALIAAGLLPIKRRGAYLGVSLALALLWVLVAIAAGRSHLLWAALAASEAILFLVLAICGKSEYGARTGPWAVAGTALLVYSLLLLPLLGRASELFGSSALPAQLSQWFGSSVYGVPFSPVLFTCGILFFALEPIVGVAFAVPLFWALLGGPATAAGVVELTGLQVALVAGTLFLLQAPEVRRGDARRSPGAAYLFANRHRGVFNHLLWALVLATLLCFFLAPRMPPPTVIVNLALLSGVGIAVWLVFTAWQSLWFRAAAWWTARTLGRIRVWLAYAWQWGVLLLAAAALWAILPFPKEASQKQGAPQPALTASQQAAAAAQASPRGPSATDHARRRAVQLFAALALLWLAHHAYRGRKRLVIGAFEGFTDDDKLDKLVAGLGPRLKSELARISDLYKVIDEAAPSRKSGFVEVITGVEDVGTILKEASAINLGPLKIPANLLVGLVGLMVSGPRLTGALHRVDKDFVLTAELSGGGLAGNWRIDANSLERPRLPPQATIQALVLQLAFRVATDLVQIGSPRWRAIRAFTEGLRAYRETQRQQGDRAPKLREAERCLIRALNDDQQFRQCHFNLGVVYRQLGEQKSAQSAFRRALKEDPESFEACYALAEAFTTDRQFRRALWFAEAAIGINPSDARAWDLQSFTFRSNEQEQRSRRLSLPEDTAKRRSLKLTLPHGDPAWDRIRTPGEIAVALAWRTLCCRALGGPSAALERDRTTALLCTRNLAVVLARAARFPYSMQLFRQAAWLAPRDPALLLYEGRTLFWNGQSGAAKALEGILADGLLAGDQALLWSVLAQAQPRSEEGAAGRSLARHAHVRFLDVAAGAPADDLADIVDLSLEAPPPQRAAKRGRPR